MPVILNNSINRKNKCYHEKSKTSTPTVTLSYEEYALYVEPSIISIDKYIQIGNKYYVPGRLINDYEDSFNLS